MLTLPNLTEHQRRELDAAIHTALTGEPVEWIGVNPYALNAPESPEIPDYFTGDTWRLVERMVSLQPITDISGQQDRGALIVGSWDRETGIEYSVALTNLRHVNPIGLGPTPQAAVVACYCDYKGIGIPEVKE